MELVLPMYNAYPYFFPQKFGQKSAQYTQQNWYLGEGRLPLGRLPLESNAFFHI